MLEEQTLDADAASSQWQPPTAPRGGRPPRTGPLPTTALGLDRGSARSLQMPDGDDAENTTPTPAPSTCNHTPSSDAAYAARYLY